MDFSQNILCRQGLEYADCNPCHKGCAGYDTDGVLGYME